MALRIAINGFGRIGRNILRAGWNSPDLEFVHINDLTSDVGVSFHPARPLVVTAAFSHRSSVYLASRSGEAAGLSLARVSSHSVGATVRAGVSF